MGVTNRHLLLLEVNLNKQKPNTTMTLEEIIAVQAEEEELVAEIEAPTPDAGKKRRRRKKTKKAKKGKKKAKKSKKARKARKSRKVAKKSKKARKGRKVAKKSKRPERLNDDLPRKPSRKPERLEKAEKPLKKPARKPRKPDEHDDESPERAESKFLTNILYFQLGLSISVPNFVVRSLIESTILRRYKLVQI